MNMDCIKAFFEKNALDKEAICVLRTATEEGDRKYRLLPAEKAERTFKSM